MEPSVYLWYSLIADIVIIPLIIQISYLGCNRRTLKSLFVNFNLKMFINTVLNRKPSRVQSIAQKPIECVNDKKV